MSDIKHFLESVEPARDPSVRVSRMQNTVQIPRVLIVENEFLIAEMIHDMVRDLGYDVTKTAHRLPSALKEISKDNFDCALVNIGIDAEKHGLEIADILKSINVPFGFITGYGHSLAERHADVPLLQKPFNADQLRDFMAKLVGPPVIPNAA